MALVNVGMTEEEGLAARNPNPAGRYILVFKGFVRKDDNDPQSIVFATGAGNLMLKARLQPKARIAEQGPDKKWKDIPDTPAGNKGVLTYFAVAGQFSYSDLLMALPGLAQGKGVDEEAVMDHELLGDLVVETEYEDKNGNKVVLERPRNVVSNLRRRV